MNELQILHLASRKDGLQVPRNCLARTSETDNVASVGSVVNRCVANNLIHKTNKHGFIIHYIITTRGQVRLKELRNELEPI